MLLHRSSRHFSRLVIAASCLAPLFVVPGNAQTGSVKDAIATNVALKEIQARYDEMDAGKNNGQQMTTNTKMAESLQDRLDDEIAEDQKAHKPLPKDMTPAVAAKMQKAFEEAAQKTDAKQAAVHLRFSNAKTVIGQWRVTGDTAIIVAIRTCKVTLTAGPHKGQTANQISRTRDTWVKRRGQWFLQGSDPNRHNLDKG